MDPVSNCNLFNHSAFEHTMRSPKLSEADKSKACAQQFDRLMLAKILEKSLESPFKDDTNSSMSGSGLYATLRAQILANSLTQKGGLKIADPTDF